jgi:hypothetical protein
MKPPVFAQANFVQLPLGARRFADENIRKGCEEFEQLAVGKKAGTNRYLR